MSGEDENDYSDDVLHRYKHPQDLYIIFNAWCKGEYWVVRGNSMTMVIVCCSRYLVKESSCQ